jgi:hypothetical protein
MNCCKITDKTLSFLLLFSLAMTGLVSCGGGGSQANSPNPSNPPDPQNPPSLPSQLTLVISPDSLPDDIPYTPYEQIVTMTASGGKLPYRTFSCTVSDGSQLYTLVEWLNSMSPTGTCKIFGKPTKSGMYTVTFKVVDDAQSVVSVSASLAVNPDQDIKKGFPVQTWRDGGSAQGGQGLHILVGNINETPTQEIIFTGLSNGPLYAWKFDGSLVSGWPIPNYYAVGFPALGELSLASPGYEVFCAYGYVFAHPDLTALTGTGKMLAGWPRQSRGVSLPAALADINGDGIDEIFITDTDGLHAYKADASELPGWPVNSFGRQFAFADLDGDGHIEIISGAIDGTGTYIFASHHDGTPVKGFPVFFPDYRGWMQIYPVVGDVDGDGFNEIVTVYGWSGTFDFSKHSGVLIISADGKIKRAVEASGKISYGSAPALADLDGDCIPEIILQTDTTLEVWRGNGSLFPGWPVHLGENTSEGNSSPVVGDVDGDQLPDIVIIEYGVGVYAFNRSGLLLPRFPKLLPLGSGAVPAIADIDLDGHNEIIVGSSDWTGSSGYFDTVWVYDLGGPKHGLIEWGQFGGGPKHQNAYACKKK